MRRIIHPSNDFLRFQQYLRTRGSIDLGALERGLEKDIDGLSPQELGGPPRRETNMPVLAKRLLLWYSLGWSVADAQDRHWSLFSTEEHPAIERMIECREQLRVYGRELGFHGYYREALDNPEAMTDHLYRELVKLTEELRVPRGEISLVSPLFNGDWDLERGRYYSSRVTSVEVPVWGPDNFTQALQESPRLHFSINRLMAKARLGTSTCHERTFYY